VIFEDGNDNEKAVLRRLQEAGVEVVQTQRPFSWPEYNITGMIDGMVRIDGQLYPLEIKSISTYGYPKVNSIQDLGESESFWLRKIPVQLAMYMLMSRKEKGYLLIRDKGFAGGGDNPEEIGIKEFEMTLDDALKYGEIGLKNAEQVNECVAEGILPPGVADTTMCMRCDFLNHCETDLKNAGALQFITDLDKIKMLERYAELEEMIGATGYDELEKEKKALDKKLKEEFTGKELISIGRFKVSGKWRERKAYEAKASKWWEWEYTTIPTLPKGGESL
jgi:hypothetical protein